ncbi:hypothetical protein JL721_3692 [Aureococcus anophagefferens]|nr:hypothetical protein JL721_3692 [Aureococcus anophagefferens]
MDEDVPDRAKTHFIGAYSPEARKRRLAEFHAKRERRWTRKVKRRHERNGLEKEDHVRPREERGRPERIRRPGERHGRAQPAVAVRRDGTVELDDVRAARALVQAVDVLRDDSNVVERPLERREGVVRFVRRRPRDRQEQAPQ